MGSIGDVFWNYTQKRKKADTIFLDGSIYSVNGNNRYDIKLKNGAIITGITGIDNLSMGTAVLVAQSTGLCGSYMIVGHGKQTLPTILEVAV